MVSKKVIYTLLAVMLVVFAFPPVYGGDEARLGTPAGVQLLVPVGPRSLAMGEANLANTQGVEAIFWNPAGLGKMNSNVGVMVSTMSIFNDVNVNYLAIGTNLGRMGTLAFSIKSFDFGDIPWTTEEDADADAGRTFSPSFVTIGLTYSKKLTSSIAFGLTGKLLSESVPRASASAFALDMGIQYDGLAGFEGVSFGIAVRNIGTNLSYSGSAFLNTADETGAKYEDYRSRETASHDLPTLVEFGLGYKRTVMENSDLLVSTVFQNNNYGYDELKLGMEYVYDKMVALRAGFLRNLDEPTNNSLYSFTLGAGFNYKLGNANLGLDYVFRPNQYFDAENMFAFRVSF